MRLMLWVTASCVAMPAAAHIGDHARIPPDGLFAHQFGAGHLPLWMLAIVIAIAVAVASARTTARVVARVRSKERRP